jgi:hypothetical protein
MVMKKATGDERCVFQKYKAVGDYKMKLTYTP